MTRAHVEILMAAALICLSLRKQSPSTGSFVESSQGSDRNVDLVFCISNSASAHKYRDDAVPLLSSYFVGSVKTLVRPALA